MTNQDLGQIHSLCQAMSVGSYTIQWLEGEDRDRSGFELQLNLAKLNRAIEDFIDVASHGNPLRDAPQQAVQGFVFCLETLHCLTQKVSESVRERLQRAANKAQTPISLLLDQTDSLAV